MKAKLFLFLMFLTINHAFASRIKDIADWKGARDNQVMGYGLVVGLSGTGDTKLEATNKSLAQMFRQMGVDVSDSISSKNVAAVIVTSQLPPFARVGSRIGVTVSSVGDAKSLSGGTLLVTPLKGADQAVYAVAQGEVIVGGRGGDGKNHPTVGVIPGAGIVEREVKVPFQDLKALRLSLRSQDFTTAARVAKVINIELGGKYATTQDSRTIDMIVPFHYETRVVDFVSLVENLNVTTDSPAKVVINERTGTVVMGETVEIESCSVSHGLLTITIEGDDSQIGRDVASDSAKEAKGEKGAVVQLPKSTKIKDVVRVLNKLGVSPRDLIDIVQAMKTAGALHAQVEVL